MKELYPNDLMQYLNVLQVFLRLLGLFLLMPGFSHNNIPPRVKILFALVLSLALYPILKDQIGPLPLSLAGLGGVALRESAVGLLMGFAAYVTFEGVALASQFIGTQMGFGAAGIVDPINQSQTSILVALQGWLILMVFFFTDMHHRVLQVFVMSYDVTGHFAHQDFATAAVLAEFIRITGKLFIMAVQMAAPFTLLIMASNVAVGILSRMLPQMNILLFSFPITILLGLCTIYFLAPDLLAYIENVLYEMLGDMTSMMRIV